MLTVTTNRRKLPASHEANHLARLQVQVDVIVGGAGGQARHGHHGADEREDEARAGGGAHVADGQHEAAGGALDLGVVGEGVLRLGHADGQLVQAHLGEAGNLFLRLLGVRDTSRAVQVDRNLLNLLLDGQLQRVGELEVGGLLAGLHHRLAERLGARAAQRVVLRHHRVKRARRDARLAHSLQLVLRVGGKAVDGHHNRDAKLLGVGDVAQDVAAARLHQLHVLVGVLMRQRRAGRDLGAAAVALERPHGGHDDDRVGLQPAHAALDVHELLHADVGAEPGLRDHVPVLADELEAHLVGDDGGVAVGDIGEGAGMDERRRLLQRLHQGGHDAVLHHHHQGAADAKVVRGHRVARLAVGHHHGAQPVAHVPKGGCQRQHGHDLGGDRDVVAGGPHLIPLRRGAADLDLAQEAVIAVSDAAPGDSLRVDVQPHKLADLLLGQVVRVGLGDSQLLQAAQHHRRKLLLALLVGGAQAAEERRVRLAVLMEHAGVDGRGEQVVGGGDGMDVAREVQVHLLHGDHLAVAPAGSTALDAKGWTLAGLPDAGHHLLVQMGAERLAEAHGGGALALAQRGGVHASDADVFAVRRIFQPVQHIQGDLGLGGAVAQSLAGQQP
mmetsp:Transcript_14930/g.38363  ORF Transcript_14930/g.38363 Transcript_14930/m.38363 type:complete len:613 (+) Transcript_14930:23-1861(+)